MHSVFKSRTTLFFGIGKFSWGAEFMCMDGLSIMWEKDPHHSFIYLAHVELRPIDPLFEIKKYIY